MRLVGSVSERERQDDRRRIGRIDLAVRRVARQVRRQLAARGVDRGLHVAGGRVDVARQIELQHDARAAQPARRRHLGHAGNAAELALERRRDGRRPSFRGSRPGSAALTTMVG